MCSDYKLSSYVFLLARLQQQTVALMQSRSFVSGAIGQLFNQDWTASAPARCSASKPLLLIIVHTFAKIIGKSPHFPWNALELP